MLNFTSFEPDGLGKCLACNLLTNYVEIYKRCIEVQRSLNGRNATQFAGDLKMLWQKGDITIEAKISKMHYHKTGGTHHCFSKLKLCSSSRPKKPYDLFFGFGCKFEHWPEYPHPSAKAYLQHCIVWIIPFCRIPGKNNFQPYHRTFRTKREYEFCCEEITQANIQSLWKRAVALIEPRRMRIERA